MSNKRDKGHDINFYRGNLSEEEYSDGNIVKELKDTYDYADFKFNKKNKMNDNYEQPQVNSELFDAQKQAQDRIVDQSMDEDYLYDKDPKIASGERKPLKPKSGNSNNNNNGKMRTKPKKNKKNKRKSKKIIIRVIIVLLLLLLVLFGYLLFIKNTAGPVNLIVIGVDQREGQPETEIRADAIMSVNASTKSNEILMASIPRDTYTYIPCEGNSDKITHSYIYGATNWPNKGGGIACTVQSSAALLDINVDKYVKVNFANMIGIINAIGGIDLKATSTFCEQDSHGKADSYCFKEGQQYHMDGEMALAYSRHRKTDDDIQRGLRQQEVFKAMFAEVKKTQFWEWPGMFIKISQMIQTNLSHKEMLQIAIIYATDGKMENYKFEWGGAYYNGVSYVELDPASVKAFTSKVNALR